MASSMERLRDRWDGLAPREQRLVAALGITFVVVLLTLLWRGINGGLAERAERNDEIRQALDALQAYRIGQAEQTETARQVEIPADPVRLQSYLEGIATEVGITIPGFNPQTPVTRDGFTESSTRIEIRELTITELTDFLEKVETREGHVVVKSLDIKRNFRDEEKLDANMVVTTFSKEKKDDEGSGDEDEG